MYLGRWVGRVTTKRLIPLELALQKTLLAGISRPIPKLQRELAAMQIGFEKKAALTMSSCRFTLLVPKGEYGILTVCNANKQTNTQANKWTASKQTNKMVQTRFGGSTDCQQHLYSVNPARKSENCLTPHFLAELAYSII
ncbi:hypothetical protein VTN77DRAFT_1097 [Rasamsonia byssochlamydoides]|uniref:uncharacterized protein n=1 Tax=Rasamsonia byssochlamydoides TaxID=89139 RepID=UPI0037445127